MSATAANDIYQHYQVHQCAKCFLSLSLETIMFDVVERVEQALAQHREWVKMRNLAAPSSDNSETARFMRIDAYDVEAILSIAIAALRTDLINDSELEKAYKNHRRDINDNARNAPDRRRRAH